MAESLRVGTTQRCPACGCDRISVRVLTWADFKGGRPHSFDPEDLDYVQPIAGGDAVCRCCGRDFVLSESP